MDRNPNKWIWEPTQEWIEGTNVHRFMQRLGIATCEEFLRFSQEHLEEFWAAMLDQAGIHWFRQYDKVLDSSQGVEWSRWFLGGKLNIADNCLDRYRDCRVEVEKGEMGREKGKGRSFWGGFIKGGGVEFTVQIQKHLSERRARASVLRHFFTDPTPRGFYYNPRARGERAGGGCRCRGPVCRFGSRDGLGNFPDQCVGAGLAASRPGESHHRHH